MEPRVRISFKKHLESFSVQICADTSNRKTTWVNTNLLGPGVHFKIYYLDLDYTKEDYINLLLQVCIDNREYQNIVNIQSLIDVSPNLSVEDKEFYKLKYS